MKISTIPKDKEKTTSQRTVFNRTDQFAFLGDGRALMNTFLWKTILNLQGVIRGVLDVHFAELAVFNVTDNYDTHDTVDIHFIKRLAEIYGQPQRVYFFQSRLMEAKRYSFLPLDVSQQMLLYSFSKSIKEMDKQCNIIQKNFLEIFNQIELPIGTSLNLLEGRKEHSTFYECWGATVGEIHPFKEDEYYVVKASIDITQIVDSFIWVNYSPRGFYLPESVAPYEYTIINADLPGLKEQAKKLHRELSKHGVRVLWDNRDIPYDEKLEFISMLGINRIIVLDGTTYEGDSEEDFTFKIFFRSTSEVKPQSLKEFLKLFKKSNLMK